MDTAANSPSLKLQSLLPVLPKVAVALSGASMLADMGQAIAGHNFFELRLDSIADPASLLAAFRDFRAAHPNVLSIATCRRQQNGGQFSGSAREELAVLQEAAAAGATILDLSLETAEELQNGPALQHLRDTPATLMLSWHDFHGTPNLQAVCSRMRALAPDIVKIVPTAKNLRDALQLMQLLVENSERQDLVAMAMGEAGVLTRVLGPSRGSLFTFAAPDNGGGTAPGQVPLRVMKQMYRVDRLTSETRILGVFGKPVSGSRSPQMHNGAFNAAEVDAVYLPFETDSAEEALEVVHRLPLQGASATMPLKQDLLPLLGRVDAIARRVGAVNTLFRDADGVLTGSNTDTLGITAPLSRVIELRGKDVLVLGAGGAARAAVFALAEAGASVNILNRTWNSAEQLANDAGATAIAPGELRHFDAIVHATPFGMTGQQIAPPILPEQIRCGVFFDLVYHPRETPLIQAAKAKGIQVIYGSEMFVEQGAAQFQLWTAKPAPLTVMREAVAASL